jgi:hypothetical protein
VNSPCQLPWSTPPSACAHPADPSPRPLSHPRHTAVAGQVRGGGGHRRGLRRRLHAVACGGAGGAGRGRWTAQRRLRGGRGPGRWGLGTQGCPWWCGPSVISQRLGEPRQFLAGWVLPPMFQECGPPLVCLPPARAACGLRDTPSMGSWATATTTCTTPRTVSGRWTVTRPGLGQKHAFFARIAARAPPLPPPPDAPNADCCRARPPPAASIQIKFEPQPQPRCITALSGHKIVGIASGGNHAIAVSDQVGWAVYGVVRRLCRGGCGP